MQHPGLLVIPARFAHRSLYRFLSPGYKAYLDHEHKIITVIPIHQPLGPPSHSAQGEIQYFWDRGIADAFKPASLAVNGTSKTYPIHEKSWEMTRSYARSQRWRFLIGGFRKDLMKVRARSPCWDKNLVPCVMESAPEWYKDVGPVQVQTIVGQEGGEGALPINPSPSVKERNLLAGSQFMYFA